MAVMHLNVMCFKGEWFYIVGKDIIGIGMNMIGEKSRVHLPFTC